MVCHGMNSARHHGLLLYKPTDAKVSFCPVEALKITILTMRICKAEPGRYASMLTCLQDRS